MANSQGLMRIVVQEHLELAGLVVTDVGPSLGNLSNSK